MRKSTLDLYPMRLEEFVIEQALQAHVLHGPRESQRAALILSEVELGTDQQVKRGIGSRRTPDTAAAGSSLWPQASQESRQRLLEGVYPLTRQNTPPTPGAPRQG